MRSVQSNPQENAQVRAMLMDAISNSVEGKVISHADLDRTRTTLGLKGAQSAEARTAPLSRRDLRAVMDIVDAATKDDKLVERNVELLEEKGLCARDIANGIISAMSDRRSRDVGAAVPPDDKTVRNIVADLFLNGDTRAFDRSSLNGERIRRIVLENAPEMVFIFRSLADGDGSSCLSGLAAEVRDAVKDALVEMMQACNMPKEGFASGGELWERVSKLDAASFAGIETRIGTIATGLVNAMQEKVSDLFKPSKKVSEARPTVSSPASSSFCRRTKTRRPTSRSRLRGRTQGSARLRSATYSRAETHTTSCRAFRRSSRWSRARTCRSRLRFRTSCRATYALRTSCPTSTMR